MFTLENAPQARVAASDARTAQRYLVAIDGTRRSDAALAIATAIADGTGADVEAVIAVDLGAHGRLPSLTTRPDDLAARRARRLARAREQMRRVTGAQGRWPVILGDGPAPIAIAEVADQSDATLIIAGSGRHRLAQRLGRIETAIALLDTTDRPVLAVPRSRDWRPTRALVATDFGPESIEGARFAIELMPRDGSLFLLHVVPGGEEATPAVRDRLETTASALRVTTLGAVEALLLHGTVVDNLLAVASAAEIDMIAIGSHGVGSFSRLLMRRAPVRVMRGASCAVLVVPERAW